ncbi:hypothetical protein Cgig2_009283 [Carnegiea gigantea]|uniref:RNA helicase n=1 Tax=Carnegiea gigantea TaxID=171969 RepID=A0A9Q1GMF1_9CARY|nr:hypothetical protein Cgig2_014904 [Carnegiea gigantea]KAJ8422281.1 hypothetical protein Cgig2_009283 [Carnegiea gigantea]
MNRKNSGETPAAGKFVGDRKPPRKLACGDRKFRQTQPLDRQRPEASSYAQKLENQEEPVETNKPTTGEGAVGGSRRPKVHRTLGNPPMATLGTRTSPASSWDHDLSPDAEKRETGGMGCSFGKAVLSETPQLMHSSSANKNICCRDLCLGEAASAAVCDRRGKKNLVLSSWGDDSILLKECMNPYYDPSLYQAYSKQTRLNLRKLNEDVIDYDLLEDLVCHIDENSGDGAILVFLPGVSEIYRLHDKLAASFRFGGESSEWLLPLHSSVAAADQKKVFLKPPQNMRKVIMATNIAETSLTIDDVVYVIDSGKHKEYRYDPKKKLSMMVEDWISQANAKQRRGRAGRVKPGTCFCLYTRHRFEKLMRRFQVPEMLRMPLVELCLQIKLLALGDIKTFLSKGLEIPRDDAIHSAISSLKEVGAIDENEVLTPLGHHLAKLPVDLLLGKV